METSRWVLGSSEGELSALISAIATVGGKVDPEWRYPPFGKPFTTSFIFERGEVLVELEGLEGVIVSGRMDVLEELKHAYDQLRRPS
jgi:hypothetical protein